MTSQTPEGDTGLGIRNSFKPFFDCANNSNGVDIADLARTLEPLRDFGVHYPDQQEFGPVITSWISKYTFSTGDIEPSVDTDTMGERGSMDPTVALGLRTGLICDVATFFCFDPRSSLGAEDKGRFMAEALSAVTKAVAESMKSQDLYPPITIPFEARRSAQQRLLEAALDRLQPLYEATVFRSKEPGARARALACAYEFNEALDLLAKSGVISRFGKWRTQIAISR